MANYTDLDNLLMAKHKLFKLELNANLALFNKDALRQNLPTFADYIQFKDLRRSLNIWYVEGQNIMANYLNPLNAQGNLTSPTYLLNYIHHLQQYLPNCRAITVAKAYRTIVLTHKELSDGHIHRSWSSVFLPSACSNNNLQSSSPTTIPKQPALSNTLPISPSDLDSWPERQSVSTRSFPLSNSATRDPTPTFSDAGTATDITNTIDAAIATDTNNLVDAQTSTETPSRTLAIQTQFLKDIGSWAVISYCRYTLGGSTYYINYQTNTTGIYKPEIVFYPKT